MTDTDRLALSVMLAVPDTPAAVAWYQRALGATLLWDLGGVAGLEIAGAPFFLGEPANNGWESPTKLGITSTRVEVFCDDPDTSSHARWKRVQQVILTRSRIITCHGEPIGRAGSRIHLGTSGS